MEFEMTEKSGKFERPWIASGFYKAKFTGCEAIPDGKFGKRVAWKFDIPKENLTNDNDKKKYAEGVTLSKITYATVTSTSMAGEIVKSFGVEIKDGKIDVDKYKGAEVMLLVDDWVTDVDGKKTTASSIDKVKPIPK